MLRVGLTGGIASGKSVVAAMLGEFGAKLVDADIIAREVVEPGEPALASIVEAFGESVLDPDGQLDRRSMRERVFSDAQSRELLESLLHPVIRKRMLDRMDCAERSVQAGTASYVVAVVPLLVETGFAEHVDRVLLVDCPATLQLERLMQRDGMSRSRAEAMLGAQADPAIRRAAADDIIDNSHAIACTRAQTWRRHLNYLKS